MEKLSWFKNKAFVTLRYLIEHRNTKLLKRNKGLWNELHTYLEKSQSTGCNISDYWEIYNYVRRHKPKEILECGTGVSTVVMAYALMENENEGYYGRITSMESIEMYLEMARDLLPKHMAKYVDFVLSPVVEDTYALYRGMRYEKIPMNRNYDFVYVDGPSYYCPNDGSVTFDFDFLHILKNSSSKVGAIIDKRVSSCYVFQKLLGASLVKYNAIIHLGFVKPCSKYDLLDFNVEQPSLAFRKSFSVLSNSKLSLGLFEKKFRQ